MRYILKDKTEKPKFQFLVKTITSTNLNYYLYNDLEKAMAKARVLSLTGFHTAIIYEPEEDDFGEWRLRPTYRCRQGTVEYIELSRLELHVKFYLECGEWENEGELEQEENYDKSLEQ